MKFTASLTGFFFLAGSAWANAIATYTFNGNYNALEAGEPSLSAVIGATGSATFTTDTVFGLNHSVVDLTGSGGGNNNTGLQLANATSVIPGASYSIEYVFLFSQNPSGWRKIEDVSNLSLDAGFYVDPGSHIDVFPVTGSAASWTNNAYHHVVLTEGSGTVTGYLDGVQQFAASSTVMNIPGGNALSFFLDDSATGFAEYSSSQVALIRLFDSALTSSDVTTLYNNGAPIDLGLAAGTAAPEPSTMALLVSGLGLALAARRRAAR